MLICEAVAPNGKTCTKCAAFKDIEEFPKAPPSKPTPRQRCRKCIAAGALDWGKRNPGQRTKLARKSLLMSRYGLTVAAYEEMLAEQGELCAVCSGPLADDRKAPCVDHSHSTGKVRGILHSNCNSALGLLRDSASAARGAATYLEKHSAAP